MIYNQYKQVQLPPNNFFFGKCFKKKLLNIFLNFYFYLKIQSFWLIMENNFIQMAASAGHAVAYTIGPIFKHIINRVQLYITNGFTNIVLRSVNYLWLVGVTVIFNGTLQIIGQRRQISAPRWPNGFSSAADNAIFKTSSKTMRKTSSVASAVWHVAPSCWNQMLPISSSSIFVNEISFNMTH